jgi:hypothetical protein
VLWRFAVQGFPVKSDSLRFEVLLSSKMLNDIHLQANFINSIGITPNRLILLSTNDQFYVLGWGGIAPLGKKFMGNIDGYAFTSDGFLMVISNNYICMPDSAVNLSKLIKLPNEGMGISPGKDVMFVYDQNKNQQKNALYLIAKGGKYARLFEVTTPINSVVEMNDSILFATENGLFSFNLNSKKIKALAALSRDKEVKSIAVDTSGNSIYFSTNNMIFALKDSGAVMITDQFGGVLRYFNEGLIVFNPEKKFLVRIAGIEDNIASKMQSVKNVIKGKTDNKTFYIIAGSYLTEQQANDAVADLKIKGFTEAEVVGKNSYGSYRISYKGYATNEEAAKDITNIKQTINPSAWIFEKK